ncbi:MAG: prephenate dehydrogenase/arogenate dehydrogenase family protein [Chloroflexi bacterium]|nr:prephenate dehydrogenase/arogenate dehydrogenase family protein [Chloroflexota bacterium]
MAKSRVTIVGLGLIGGSIGLALKNSKLDIQVVGHDKDHSAAGRAQKRGAVDTTKWNLIDACDGAGLIVLAIPLDGIKDTLSALKSSLAPGTVVADTASSKVPVMEWARDLPEGVSFVGTDPVLRAESRRGGGIDAASADLFQGTTFCLVPSPTASHVAVDSVASLVALLGARPYFVDAAEHDGLMAAVEHLPALVSTALQSATMRSRGWREMARLAGGNYRAAADLAPASPTALETFLAHRVDLIRWIDELTNELREFRGVLEREDSQALAKLLDAVADERARWLSGKLDLDDTGPEMPAIDMNPARLFFGGLADRPKKRDR